MKVKANKLNEIRKKIEDKEFQIERLDSTITEKLRKISENPSQSNVSNCKGTHLNLRILDIQVMCDQNIDSLMYTINKSNNTDNNEDQYFSS